MKLPALVVAAVCLVTASCKKDEPAPAPKSEPKKNSHLDSNSSGNPMTAPVDYLGAVAKAKRTAEKVTEEASLSKHIQMFQSQEGRFPQSLDELVKEKYIPAVPPPPFGHKYQYNPASGELKVVRQ
ncbi:MAG: hypothetical protein FJ386_07250 [Verrucomicrobia bacterium]|nr:hypothetical protein [Verrucomicrobiota bacterium]